MDADLLNTVVLYAPGVAILIWVVIRQEARIDKLMERCVLLDKHCEELVEKQGQGLERSGTSHSP